MRNSCIVVEKKKWMKQEWVDSTFADELNDVVRKRIEFEKDNPRKPLSIRRMTKAIRNLKKDAYGWGWEDIKKRLINANLEEDRWINEN